MTACGGGSLAYIGEIQCRSPGTTECQAIFGDPDSNIDPSIERSTEPIQHYILVEQTAIDILCGKIFTSNRIHRT